MRVASVTVFGGSGVQFGGGVPLTRHVAGAPTLRAPYAYRFHPGGRGPADMCGLTAVVVGVGVGLARWCDPPLQAAAAHTTNATTAIRKGPLTRSTTLRTRAGFPTRTECPFREHYFQDRPTPADSSARWQYHARAGNLCADS